MLAFSEHRRSPPDVHQIRPGMGASHRQVRQLEERCRKSGLKMTDLRRVLLHGILEAGADATAVEIWKALLAMMKTHAPSQGSIQRNLNLLVERDVLHRAVGPDRVWRYRVTPERMETSSAITFVNAATGRNIPFSSPEIAALLHRAAAEYGLAIRSAAITVAPESDEQGA
ncbi:Fur family transcriptional regulator [Acetobacter conturbans]|uniref:Fur family transcriptional regulator n=1 Tax=Acetobacter conturbans TaxID=1737472 RepID=A0ABX0K2L7_9PROT|nr:transcriptional repressor [Acetobacter conturbans]NHN89427.1 Fur family transcriptional regulator [Acetobacter conturbans]